jgi:hypothetical protein
MKKKKIKLFAEKVKPNDHDFLGFIGGGGSSGNNQPFKRTLTEGKAQYS